jgi:hypothetical protein
MFSLPEIRNGDYLNPVLIRAWAETLAERMKIA